VDQTANRCELTACIAELKAMRYTPAGIPALNMTLEHVSEVVEAGQARQVKATLRAVALGMMAERLATQALGSVWRFTGFLATPRNGKHVQLHIQEFSTTP
jgi:primosomal replication protein N